MKLAPTLRVIAAFFAVVWMLNSTASAQAPTPYKYKYETAADDDIGALVYKLDNGLTVYMSIYKDEPRVQTAIAVRAGSKNDPADATGLAHYLEHMLFKGNSEIATIDWESEQKLLKQISDTYEALRNTTDEAKRKELYGEIDRLSGEAAKFAVPNEYDKMISSLGAKGTNAFTSTEMTVYINDIPANELEKWLTVESSRFQELTLRLFHTELETVYEEFNRGQDNDYSKSYHALNRLLYQSHPYGTQTTIGTGEHLKNPSMVKIHEYFDTYYNPNNIAICLSGDLDPDKTIDMIVEKFGSWKPKPIPEFSFEEEKPISKPRKEDVYGPMPDWLQLGWRFNGAHSEDAKYVRLLGELMYNGQAGLIDLNLVQQQKVLGARGGSDVSHDYSDFSIMANPRQGQSLEEVEALLLEEVEKLQNGEFDDWMLQAVIRNMKREQARALESNWERCFSMVMAFILRQQWEEAAHEIDEVASISKADFVAWAKANLTDKNYVAVYKHSGEDPNLHKVEKPQITPLDINRDQHSSFFNEFEKMPSTRLEPAFVDFKSAIKTTELGGKVPMSYIKNDVNDIFTMYYVLDMGSLNDPKLPIAVQYLPYLGTDKYTAEDLQKEFYKLAVEFDVFQSRDRVYVYLRGIEESLEKGMQLFEHLLANAKPDQAKLEGLISDIRKERADAKKNKWSIMYSGMFDYARYGAQNPFNSGLSDEELGKITADELVKTINALTSYKHRILYYGNREMNDVAKVVEANHSIADKLMDYPPAKKFEEIETKENKVLFVDYDMVQTEMMFVSKGKKFDKSMVPAISLFNEYFGSGLSSIVFQEIREAKALAYSAWCGYTTPRKADESHYVRAYVGTQTDKLGDAVDAMLELMNEMPKSPDQFEAAKLAALKKIETDRITRTSIFWNYENAKDKGIDYDLRKDTYAALPKMSLEELDKFFKQNVKGNSYTFLVIGKKADMDMEALKKLGTVKELTLEEIFGY